MLMSFRIITTFVDGDREYEIVECTECGHREQIRSDQDFPCECVGCLEIECNLCHAGGD